MPGDRPRHGLLLSTLGAVLLAVSVFLPWYALTITGSGIAFIQRAGTQFAAQFGNAQLQGAVAGLHADLSALAGRQLGTVSGHQALANISVVLLVLASLGLLLALSALARPLPLSSGSYGELIAVLGALAVACVLYRVLRVPDPAPSFVTFSLRGGAWLSLLGSLAMVAGGLSTRSLGSRSASEVTLDDAWSGLSGWTPGTPTD